MPLTIHTNLNSMGAQRHAARSQHEVATTLSRLSSGLRIQSARDDAAGLAISDRFMTQTRGTGQAARNANDAISLVQTAESALGSVNDGLQRIRELAVQSANATHSSSDRAALQQEVAQLVQEIDRVATQTQFNGVNLLDGSFAAQSFQVGANAEQTIALAQLGSVRPRDLGRYEGASGTVVTWGVPSNTPTPLTVRVGSAPTLALGSVAVDSKAIAAAINNANIQGLSASANATVVRPNVSFAFATSAGTATYTINGVAIPLAGVNGEAALAGNRAAAVSAINAQSAATGVVAHDDGAGVGLTAADGRNMTLAYSAGTFTGSNPADFGLRSTTIAAATMNYSYVAPPGGGTGVLNITIGFGGVVDPIASIGTPVDMLDVSTVAGANTALASADRALATVNATRAALGALQNRFGSTLSNLANAFENLTAARSRIQDADFAMETANLSRAQVLQQAGTAMIAQANQLPGQVLALLR